MNTPIHAGFPNPAEDAGGFALDLNRHIVQRPVSTYYLRIEGNAMEAEGVAVGDIVVVDRSLAVRSGDLVIVAIDGDFVLRKFKKQGHEAWLVAPGAEPQSLRGSDASLWGVVTFTIHRTRRK